MERVRFGGVSKREGTAVGRVFAERRTRLTCKPEASRRAE